MKDNEDVSFLQGVEGRLDSLVDGEAQKKDDTIDQSKVISEIEKSFNAIFGEKNKEAATEIKEQPAAEEIVAKPEISENKNTDEIQFIPPAVEEITLKAEQMDMQSLNQAPPDPVPQVIVPSTPLDIIRSIIKSLEKELSNANLDLLDDEISKFHTLNEGDTNISGFLGILQFLGRYIRARGPGFDPAALALLLSAYDNLEDVILSENMTNENKHVMLLDVIRRYREWSDKADEVNELSDVKSDKGDLDLFLSSVTGKKMPLPAEMNTADETISLGEQQYEHTSKTKNTDFDEESTVRWERPPYDIKNASRSQSEDIDSNDQASQAEPEEAARHKITAIALIIVFLILSITTSGLLWFYPERRNQVLRWVVSNVPYTDRILTVEKAQKNPDVGKIGFIDVRYRFIRNTTLGRTIRVTEGIVINNTAGNISKVKLTGELYDAEGLLLLISKVSIAGNILGDEKLETLDEDRIFSALSMAPISNLSESRIPPMGQVPFMIVFTREPAKVFKLVIIPVLE